MGTPDKPSLESLSEGTLEMIAGGAITDEHAQRFRTLIGQAKAHGWGKDEFFA